MYTINLIKTNKVKRLNRLTLFCTLFILVIAFGSCSSPEAEQKKDEQSLLTQNLTKTTIPIEGMTCVSCAASIKKELKSLDALERVEVSLEHRNATVFYEEGTISPLQVQQAINSIGYKAGEPIVEATKE